MLEKDISEGEYFRVNSGPVLPSLLALRSYLRMIPQWQFDAHVNAQKNDFANWTEHVFGEKELAERMRKCTSREQMMWELDDAFANVRMEKVIADKYNGQKPEKKVTGQAETADPIALQEDAEFSKYTQQIVKTNEDISKKYDDVAQQLKNALLDPVPKDVEQRTEQLMNSYTELMGKISETRKQGKDAFIPALVIRPFLSKLSLAKITRDAKDFAMAQQVLDDAQRELAEAQSAVEVNVKKEIAALVEKMK